MAGRNKPYLLSAVNLDLNRSVSILYKTYSLVFKKLEASDSPTINLVIPCYYKLHSLLKRISGDEQPILILKQCIMDGLNNKFSGTEEIEVYKSLSIAVADCDFLQFWRKNSDKLPLLSRVARKVLGTQASSGQSERLYSDCGLTVSERREKLSPATVEAIEMVSMAFKRGLYK